VSRFPLPLQSKNKSPRKSLWLTPAPPARPTQDYIGVKSKHAVYVPHTAGRYAQKRFRKAQCPIVERSVPETRWSDCSSKKALYDRINPKNCIVQVKLFAGSGSARPKAVLRR
jgi:hypothetical protein